MTLVRYSLMEIPASELSLLTFSFTSGGTVSPINIQNEIKIC